MSDDNLELNFKPRVLASDLDGTLIPLPDEAANRSDLRSLKDALAAHSAEIVFATGRPFPSVLDAIERFDLPEPRWVVCDVGTTICRRDADHYHPFDPYREHLAGITGETGRAVIEEAFSGIEGLHLQDAANQMEYKVSFFCESEGVGALVDRLNGTCRDLDFPWSATGSVDPFENCGLIDLLPVGTSKAYALEWLAAHADYHPGEVVYAGDSGNDLAALTCGFRAIVVANASAGLRENVASILEEKGWTDRLYAAKATATSGVLEGCRHFGLIGD